MTHGVMMQYFEWYLNKNPHLWKVVKENAKDLKEAGFTALWLPPAYKGIGGSNDVGYGVYDIYDLGEFNAQGSVRTKYGTKKEYLEAVETLHQNDIGVYVDIVFNHMMGADENEEVPAEKVSRDDHLQILDEETIVCPSRFTFKSRNGKYNRDEWNHTHFDGIDVNVLTNNHDIYLFKGKHWENEVDNEFDNYDYLMGCDLDFDNQQVIDRLKKYADWYYDLTHFDGVRLDALKHIKASFYLDWLQYIRSNKDIFAVGEYWHGDIQYLMHYLEEVNYCLSLFDVPLHYRMYDASHSNGQFDMRDIFKDTLVSLSPTHAVTFVDNHDTQPDQGLESFIEDWFKIQAYALILLRIDGYPCVFYGDYYGMAYKNISGKKEVLDILLSLRKEYLDGNQTDYFDDPDCIGWSNVSNDKSMVVLLTNASGKSKHIQVSDTDCYYTDVLHHCDDVYIDHEGYGNFNCQDGSISIYIRK